MTEAHRLHDALHAVNRPAQGFLHALFLLRHALAVLILAAVLVLLVVAGPAAMLHWAAEPRHAVYAIWAQAIGSIAAILTAVIVPQQVERRRRQEAEAGRQLRSRIISVRLLPSVTKIHVSAVRAEHMLKKLEALDLSIAQAEHQRHSAKIHHSNNLHNVSDEFTIFGVETGHKLMRLITQVSAYNVAADTLGHSPEQLRYLQIMAARIHALSRDLEAELRHLAAD